jgi:hypothetical protein
MSEPSIGAGIVEDRRLTVRDGLQRVGTRAGDGRLIGTPVHAFRSAGCSSVAYGRTPGRDRLKSSYELDHQPSDLSTVAVPVEVAAWG